ncbi:MAG TPA: aldehyde dehydrogenase family protein [Candidatus Thermoplasmatota archaeon]|nr:aldehyde dehydrogenase family protein [Candidatus Thermoplasmatota archaeon]
MTSAGFTNENTWLKASASPEALEAFHHAYEASLKKVRGTLGRTYPMLIGGREVTAAKTFDDTNPANRDEVVARFQKGGPENVDQAVAAARAAQPAWEALGWEKRAALFAKAGDLMAAAKYDLAALMTLENGKNRVEAIYDVDEAIDFLRYYAHQMRANQGYEKKMGEPFPGERCTSVMRPFGVFGVIGPFNFPLAIPTGMATGALITGNTVVLKPASDTPLMSWEYVQIALKAGVPKEAVNFVTGGGREVGQPLLDHPGIDGVVFTGSREVGMKNYATFVGRRPRPYICEMGGKNAIVVTAKADLDKAVDGVLKSAFGFGGQKCSAASRAYVHRSKHDAFIERLAEKARALKVGNPESRDNGFGPVVNEGAVRTYEDAVAKAKAAGGRFVVGGRALKDGSFSKGHFVEPAVVTGLPEGHDAFRSEYFVPFIAVAPYEDIDRVIDEVNAVDYGLTSGIFSEDSSEIQRYFDRVQAGVVYANRARGGSTGAMVGGQSFGGWKFSATTSRGAGGPHYLEQFMREQSRTVQA